MNNIAGQDEVITPELLEGYEGLIAPADKDGNSLILPANGQVWCLTNATFANGQNHIALSLCEADTDVGPICLAVWNGTEFIDFLVPPAPDFVLEVNGPIPFCKKFNTSPDEVFPLVFSVVPQFKEEPHQRTIAIQPDGRKAGVN